jgi:predicted RNA-binding protein
MNKTLIIILVIFLAASCKNSGSRKAIKESDIHEVIVKEAMNAAGYTYLLVSEGRNEQWLAVNEMNVSIGTTYYYQGGLKMSNFKSRELDRVFESIVFVEQISLEPPLPPEEASLSSAHSSTIPIEKLDISVEVAQDGISIADLISDMKSYDGKTVRIRGQVTKYNADIMDKNWIHIQDGTEYDGKFDLTITSDVAVETGNVLSFEGKIALDRDFGFGYFYEIIMEEAKIID